MFFLTVTDLAVVQESFAGPDDRKIPVPKSETCGISDSIILDLLATLRDSIQRGVCDLLTCTEAARQSPVVCIFVGDVG